MTNGKHSCIICGRLKQDGLMVKKHFICEECEQTIVATTPQDEEYRFLVQRVKQLWIEESRNEALCPSLPARKFD